MTIVCYKKNIESDVIYIKSNPVVGIIAVSSFVENVVGVTGTEFFTSKVFRYSKDGVNFSEWEDLLVSNLTSLTFDSKDSVIFELSYKRNTPNLPPDVIDVQLISTDSPTNYIENYFQNSIFSEFFNSSDLELLNWYINVLQKVYSKGVLPDYIERLDDFQKDEDFISFWKSIAKFFSYFVLYAKKFGEFYENERLLREYLEQRNLKTSIHDTLIELQYLMTTYYKQVLNRGTLHIIDDSSIITTVDVNGELLRLIWYLPTDEFIFNLHKNEHFGWNVGNSSPLWRGLYMNQNLYKSLSSDEWIKIDSSLAYGCKFNIQTGDEIDVQVESKDKDGNVVDLFSYKDGNITTFVLEDFFLQRSDKKMWVHFFLYPYNKTPFIQGITNLNQGNHLILNQNSTSVKITISINNSATILDYSNNSYCFYPLFTSYSHGIIQVPNWISSWLKNNNKHYSEVEIKQYIRKYLIPYNSHLELFKESDGGVEIVEVEPSTGLAWRG